MRIKIKKIKYPIYGTYPYNPWRCYLIQEDWEIPIIVGNYESQSKALEAGIIAYKYSMTNISPFIGSSKWHGR